MASALELMAETHDISLSPDLMAETVFSPAKPVDGFQGLLIRWCTGFLGLPEPGTVDQAASVTGMSSQLKAKV